MSPVRSRLRSAFRMRAALGLHPVTAPVMLFIPLGVLIGPLGLGILSNRALGHLDIVVSIGLATLGVFIGVAAGHEGLRAGRLFAASTIEAATTILIVAAALLLLLDAWGLAVDLPPVVCALALGVSAAASAAPSTVPGDEHTARIAARVADLDDVLPIALGAAVVAVAATGQERAATVTLLTLAAGIGSAAAGWLLFERAHGAAERGVFVLGTLALLGGTAAYLGGSPLLAGLAAGWFWVGAPGHTDQVAATELRKAQHPLVVLLLITAGASLQPSLAGVWLFAAYVVFRLAGKVIGGWTASLVAPGIAPSDLGTYLIPPGVIGIAFALNVAQVAPGSGATLVFAVSAGAVACELLALVLTPAPHHA